MTSCQGVSRAWAAKQGRKRNNEVEVSGDDGGGGVGAVRLGDGRERGRASGTAATICRPARSPAAPAPPPAPAPKPYDGGQPTNPPDKAGKEITVVDVPKLIGIGYFNATSKGMQDAAKELGNVKVKTDGPTEAKIDEQIKFIDNYITSGVDGILFAANDPVAIAPVLKKALSKGIHVVGYDANSTPDAREWFVNQAEFNGIGKAMMDSMAKEIGEDASFAIVTSTFTTPNQARWIAEMQAYAAKCHPKMQWLETVEAQEDNNLSFNQATTLINKYGDKLEGPVRHDVGRDAGFGRSGDQGRPLRQGRGRRPRHAERDEALRPRRLRQVGGACGTRSISATRRST